LVNNYNYGRFIAKAISSAIEQTYENCEIIVVDDGSTDNSRDVISSFGNRVSSVLKSNGGQSSAFNQGYARSRGDLICFLDSDDVFLPTKVERIVQCLEDRLYGWCFHHLQWTDIELKPIPTPSIPYRTGGYDLRAELLTGECPFSPPATSGLAFTKRLLDRLMPMPEAIKITSDNYLKFSSIAIGPGYFLNEQLALQRLHGANAYTGKKDEILRANVQLMTAAGIRERVPALRPLCSRLYADALIGKWRAGADIWSICAEMQKYMTNLSLSEKSGIVGRIASKAARRGMSLRVNVGR
jgi:glycosyltransferase involved in cell wall biosynthesis